MEAEPLLLDEVGDFPCDAPDSRGDYTDGSVG
jgi:hypothetical protein